MTGPQTSPTERQKYVTAARDAARRAAFALARDSGAPIITRPPYHGAVTTVRDVEPLAGLRAAREIELAARHTVRTYIRDAREAGHDWHDIGTALNITPRESDHAGASIAEAAYAYAADQPDTGTAPRYGPLSSGQPLLRQRHQRPRLGRRIRRQ